MRKIILFNLYTFLFWILASSFFNFSLAFLKYLRSFSSFIIIFVLVGYNLTAIIQLFLHQKFSKIEILSVASILALIIVPFLVTIEYTFFGYLSPKLPFVNSLLIFVSLLAFYQKRKASNLENFDFLNFKINKHKCLNILKSPLFYALIICSTAIAIAFTAFYALPELDPYYWYSSFQEMNSKGMITLLSGYRPLFISLIYIINQSCGIDLYATFKYVLPSLSIMVLIPSWLVAQTQNTKLKQFSILLLSFINASAFLYSQMPIPQAILNITIYYFVFFLLYSWLTQKSSFYFLSGVIILFAYFYHESAIFVFLIWLVIAAIFYRNKIITAAKENVLSSFLIAMLFILNLTPFLRSPFSFLSSNIEKIPPPGHSLNINLFFPAQYVNIDGNIMGWGDLTGVIKYYAFYVGPAFFIIFLFFAYFLFHIDFKKSIKKILLSKELLTLTLAFLCFFSLSEILPRLLNLALLPERAWIFGGIFSIVFLFMLFKYINNKIFYTFILIALFINLGGALYINSLKKHVVTSGNLKSAEWIKENLPEDRIIFSNTNQGSMELYSGSTMVDVSNNFYSDWNAYQDSLNKFKYGDTKLLEKYQELINEVSKNISDLNNYSIKNERNKIEDTLNHNLILSKKISTLLSLPNNEEKRNLYIYYSRVSANNPYANRPYYKLPVQSEEFIFDKYPDEFKEIYNDKANDIIIWKIL